MEMMKCFKEKKEPNRMEEKFLRKNPFLVIGIFLASIFQTGYTARIKDVARLQGQAEMQLVGYGLVVGLKGTGDGTRTRFTTQSVINMLRNMGIELPQDRVSTRNAAAVMVTTIVSPYNKRGSQLDVTVSSLGDARSLEGGTLLMSPLQGMDGEVYALAQGALSVGGISQESSRGRASSLKNHVLVGEIPAAAILQKEIPNSGLPEKELRFALTIPDFSSSVLLAKSVNQKLGANTAMALDPALVSIKVPESYKGKVMELISEIENLSFEPSRVAKVVLNEKTGTVIAGGEVSISEVAVSHGNILVEIKQNEQTQIQTGAAPGAVTQQSATNIQENIKSTEDRAEMKVMPASTSVQELARSLNALGVTPRDVISIFQAIRKAGALNAELILM